MSTPHSHRRSATALWVTLAVLAASACVATERPTAAPGVCHVDPSSMSRLSAATDIGRALIAGDPAEFDRVASRAGGLDRPAFGFVLQHLAFTQCEELFDIALRHNALPVPQHSEEGWSVPINLAMHGTDHMIESYVAVYGSNPQVREHAAEMYAAVANRRSRSAAIVAQALGLAPT